MENKRDDGLIFENIEQEPVAETTEQQVNTNQQLQQSQQPQQPVSSTWNREKERWLQQANMEAQASQRIQQNQQTFSRETQGMPQQPQREDMPNRTQMPRKRRERRRKRGFHWGRIAVLLFFFIGMIGVSVVCIKKYAPSRTVRDLNVYFDVPEGQVLMVLHDQVQEQFALLENDVVYLPYEFVVNHVNKRFYFDTSENILSYTTATEIIRTEVGATSYYINKSKMDLGYQIVKAKGENVYIALDYVEQFSNIEYQRYENPNRMMIETGWGNTYSYYTVNKSTKLRWAQSIKSDIVAKLEEKDVLRVIEDGTQLLEGYAKVMTKDGVTGYVKTKYLSGMYEEELTNDYKEEVYPNITKEETINMVWHQVTNMESNYSLLNALANTKGVNVVSPTWFSIADNSGEITSLASELYVERAHNNGVEVWALCDDFKAVGDTIDLATVLGNTTSRDKLINGLLASAIEYNLDGINIDFEYISAKSAAAYLEFLRELSVKCRNNGIVLSVDSYVPSDYTTFYDREEQGKVVDYVVVMAYDEHYGGSEESGSVASIGFVEEAVENIVNMVDPSKVIIGMPFYTRLWKEQNVDGELKVSSSAHSMSDMENILSRNGVTAKWDKTTKQNYAQFEADQCVYKVWVEDSKSIEAKLEVIFKDRKQGKVAGVASWKLGLEKPSIWNTIVKYTN